MEFKNIHIKELIILLIILILLKIGVNIIYEKEIFTIENINYSITTLQMEQITTAEFSEILKSSNDNISPVIVYMGRKSCPACVELLPIICSILEENDTLANGDDVKQYYFDSEKNKNEETQKLRESIGAKFVPSIIVIQGREISVFDSDDIVSESFSNEMANLLNK